MASEEKKENWWKTLPGVLSGFAALLTAVGGLVVAINQTGLLSNTEETSPSKIVEPPRPTTNRVVAGIELPAYVVLDSAWEDKRSAQRRLVELNHAGYSNTGFFWIPDFDYLSGAELYQVYVGPFKNKLTAVGALCEYRQKFSKNTYGIKLALAPGREEIRCR